MKVENWNYKTHITHVQDPFFENWDSKTFQFITFWAVICKSSAINYSYKLNCSLRPRFCIFDWISKIGWFHKLCKSNWELPSIKVLHANRLSVHQTFYKFPLEMKLQSLLFENNFPSNLKNMLKSCEKFIFTPLLNNFSTNLLFH